MAQPRNETRATRPRGGEAASAPRDEHQAPSTLDCLPGDPRPLSEVQAILAGDADDEQRTLIAELLSYAPWDTIWAHLEPARVGELLPELDLPDGLRAAWERWLEAASVPTRSAN
jgi:hypothetical protein